jgi:hypothetical protein
MIRWSWAILCLLLAHDACAIPFGYRYVGSRMVSEGRHVYWYWNTDFVQIDASGTSFIANLYARNLELNEERPFVAIIRCDTRTYRRADSKDPFDRIEDGDPVFEVWRAGCNGGRALSLAARTERLGGSVAEKAASPEPPLARAAPPPDKPAVPARADNDAPATLARGDERRVDGCVRFAEGKASQFGDATITNTCAFAVEVAYCYKGGKGGAFDCPAPPRRKRLDSLGPGAMRSLPEYRRGSNSGIALVACKGAMGSVIPQLNGDGGKGGCS